MRSPGSTPSARAILRMVELYCVNSNSASVVEDEGGGLMSMAAKRLAPSKGEKLKTVQRANSTSRYTLVCRAGEFGLGGTASAASIGEEFRGALKKAGQPTKGKYSNVPTSSGQFAAKKQEEIDLEEHSQ